MSGKKLFFDLLFIILVGVLIWFIFWMVGWLKSEEAKCVANPVKYFEEKNEGATCTCQKQGAVFDSDAINFSNINMSAIKLE